ncbi:response regulator transcription factor [Roseibium sp. M-1]
MAAAEKSLISIVDDYEAAREAVAGLVRSFGFVAAMFESAGDFLQSEKLPQTTCLIVDVLMPGMSGPELYRHLKTAGNPPPAILITAYPDEADKVRALDAGFHSYLAKPLRPDELLTCIRSAIGQESGRAG